jgi:hypothetical protein
VKPGTQIDVNSSQLRSEILFCPECSIQHIDEGEWKTRPHKTHQCQGCLHEWKPFDEYTVGVLGEKTMEAKSTEQTKKDAVNSIAEGIYRAFCENASFDDDGLDQAFYVVVEEFGQVESGSTIDNLMIATIRHAVEAILGGNYDEAIEEWCNAR